MDRFTYPVAGCICGIVLGLLMWVGITHISPSCNKQVTKDELVGEWDVWVENRGYMHLLHWTYNNTPDQFKNMRHLVLGHPGNFHALYSDTSLDPKDINETWLSKPNGRWCLDGGGKIYLDFGNTASEKANGVFGGLLVGNSAEGPIAGGSVSREQDWSYTIDAGQGIYLRLFKCDQRSFFWKKWMEFQEETKRLQEEKRKKKSETEKKAEAPKKDTKESLEKGLSSSMPNRQISRLSVPYHSYSSYYWNTMDTPVYTVPVICATPAVYCCPVGLPVVVAVPFHHSYVPSFGQFTGSQFAGPKKGRSK